MATVGHLAVGLAAARLQPLGTPVPPWAWALTLVTLSFLPDADVVAFALGIPYHAPFGHRGASHSLAFAVFLGALAAATAHRFRLPWLRAGLCAILVAASHGLLDMLTDGGLGIALFWPFSETRHFAAWRPLPVAPLGARLLSPRGLQLMLHEALMFLPLFVVAAWPLGRAARQAHTETSPRG